MSPFQKHDLRKAHLALRETGGKIDELGFHNANAIVDQIMARLKIDKEERTSTATQHATKLDSTNQDNYKMESQMKILLDQVHALPLANPPIMEAITAADAAAAPVGDADVHNHQIRPLQSTAGPTVTADTAAKNAHTLL